MHAGGSADTSHEALDRTVQNFACMADEVPFLSLGLALRNDMMLCSTCLAALQELKHATYVSDSGITMLHHGTIAGLAQAATSGCLVCHTLWAGYSESEKELLLASDGDDLLAAQGLPAHDDRSHEAYRWRSDVEQSCGTTCHVIKYKDMPGRMCIFVRIAKEKELKCGRLAHGSGDVAFHLIPSSKKGRKVEPALPCRLSNEQC